MPEAAWLIAGLGNPGPAHAGARHNVGFRVVAALAAARDPRGATARDRLVFQVGQWSAHLEEALAYGDLERAEGILPNLLDAVGKL